MTHFFLQNAKALKAKKDEGNKAFKEGNYKLAFTLYTEALAIDPNNRKTNAKLYCNRGTVNSKVSAQVESFLFRSGISLKPSNTVLNVGDVTSNLSPYCNV